MPLSGYARLFNENLYFSDGHYENIEVWNFVGEKQQQICDCLWNLMIKIFKMVKLFKHFQKYFKAIVGHRLKCS